MDLSVLVERETVVRERGAKAITAEAFQSPSIRGFNGATGMSREPVHAGAEVFFFGVPDLVVVEWGGAWQAQGIGRGGMDVGLVVAGPWWMILDLINLLSGDVAEAKVESVGEVLDVVVGGRWKPGEGPGTVGTLDEEAVWKHRMEMRVIAR